MTSAASTEDEILTGAVMFGVQRYNCIGKTDVLVQVQDGINK